mmetsp:Transcript_63534/g.187563  ORF Transcript_63534/g.187563 Transcript_63534/m.187563 type:complete len:109 (-) Transcript_63534:203-529(-)
MTISGGEQTAVPLQPSRSPGTLRAGARKHRLLITKRMPPSLTGEGDETLLDEAILVDDKVRGTWGRPPVGIIPFAGRKGSRTDRIKRHRRCAEEGQKYPGRSVRAEKC